MTSLPHPSYGQLLLDTEKDHGQENDETLAAYIISGRPPQNHQERMDFRKFLKKQKSIHPSLLYYVCLKAYESNSLQWISSALLTVPTATLKVGFENGYIQEINAAINSLDFNQTKEYIQRLAADKPLPDKDINRLIDIVLLQKTRATMKNYPNLIQELDEHVQMSLGNRLGNDERSATIRKALLETKATINHTNNNRTIPKM